VVKGSDRKDRNRGADLINSLQRERDGRDFSINAPFRGPIGLVFLIFSLSRIHLFHFPTVRTTRGDPMPWKNYDRQRNSSLGV